MSDFTELNLPKTLDTSTTDIIGDFFVPVLARAIRYDRGVGFFSSSWIRIASKGLMGLVENQGQARWITSPILNEDDWKALWAGNQAREDEMLRSALFRNVNDLARDLETDTLSALAWMVADGILDFRLALPRNKLNNEFHAKFGVFVDGYGNQIAFNGSYNDSITGTRNYEEIDIFCSWIEEQIDWVERRKKQFQRLWDNQDQNVRVFELPEAVKEKIIKWRNDERPYKAPDWIKIRETTGPYLVSYPKNPRMPGTIVLREYQEEAISAWFANQCRGLFEMATGTGKTITAIAASVRLFEREKRLVVVMACPFTHLVSQWAEDFERFGYKYITIFGSAGPWQDELANQLLDFAAGYVDNLAILTTHDTFSDPRFWEIIEQRSLSILLIADEVHELGAPQRKQGLRASYLYRLGLSATPKRWLDEEGTDFLFSYFDRTVFEFSLADAIPEYLTPYDYYPFFVELNEDELEEYYKLTVKLSRRARATADDEKDKVLERYLIERQRIITNAQAKYDCLKNILKELKDSSHTLVYCSPEQIDQVQNILNSYRIVQHRFTGSESLRERELLLESFAKGQHKMLVAMKCLDQGVDVPPTRNAIFLASSGNPKQFIQRRGRILRKFPGKEKASIYDIIVVPTLSGNLAETTFEMERKILKRELRRYNEFASLALNSTHALNQIGPIKRKYLLQEENDD